MGVGKAEFDCTYITEKAHIKKGPLRIKLQSTECFLYLFFFHSYFDFKIFKHKGDVKRDDPQQRFLAQHIVAML